MHQLERFLREEEGATAVEYALIVAAIAAVIVLTVMSVGGKVEGSFSDMDSKMPASTP